MFFVLDLDNPDDSDKTSKNRSARKPIDLDEAGTSPDSKAAKGESKLEIVRDTSSTSFRRIRKVDPVKEKRRRVLLSSILVVATVAAIALVVTHFMNRNPTFDATPNTPLPITSAPMPINRTFRAPGRASNPVIPHQQGNPVSTMPGLDAPDDRGKDSTSGGIN
jgi:hypothetical protein